MLPGEKDVLQSREIIMKVYSSFSPYWIFRFAQQDNDQVLRILTYTISDIADK